MGLSKQYSTLTYAVLELQRNIEEKRLIWGSKLENFLLKKLTALGIFFSKIFAAKSCAFFGTLAIVAVSILIRSTRDIGHDSGAYLDMAAKLLAGGKYYQDFFESNFPLALCITVIPVFFAKIFAISPIIASEIFVNLVGISAIYFSAKILERSNISKDRTTFNLIILSFAVGFFLRTFTLQFNEFATKSTYLLAFAIPYISYQFLNQTKKSDQILIGILAALLFCLKPHYGILVIVFELTKLLEKKSIKPAFCLRNYTTISLLLFYLLILFKCFPDFIAALPALSDSYYRTYSSTLTVRFFFMLREDLFPVFLLIFLSFFLVKQNQFLRPLFLASLASGFLIILEMIAGYDQRFAFYSLSLPLLLLLGVLLLKNNYINWRRDGVILLIILIGSQFDATIFAKVVFNSGAFWWVMVLILSAKWREILKTPKVPISLQFLLPHNLFSWLYFIGLTILTISLTAQKEYNDWPWLFATIILILLIIFYQKLHEKTYGKKEFSAFSSAVITIIFAYLVSLHLVGIFNLNSSRAYIYKSPNNLNNQIVRQIKSATRENDEIVIISNRIAATYPVSNYTKKSNHLPSLHLSPLYEKISGSNKMSESDNYLFSRLKQQIERKENKLIFVQKNQISFDRCAINFLEYYLRDPEFKKVFLENYVFLNQIITLQKAEKEVKFFDDNKTLELPQSTDFIDAEVEVYIKKNDQ